MASICEWVNRNVATIRLLDRIENHPKFPPNHRGAPFQRYVFLIAAAFHAYLLISAWIGAWTFGSKCSQIELYERLILIAVRLGIVVLHGVGAAYFTLLLIGGHMLPHVDRMCHLYHIVMVAYGTLVAITSVLVMLGSLLSLDMEQFFAFLIRVPFSLLRLLWHIIICEAFLRWMSGQCYASTVVEPKVPKASPSPPPPPLAPAPAPAPVKTVAPTRSPRKKIVSSSSDTRRKKTTVNRKRTEEEASKRQQ